MQRSSRSVLEEKTILWVGATLVGIAAFWMNERSAEAYDFSIGDVEIAFDTTLTFGVQVRTDDPDRDNFCTTIGGPNAQGDPNPVPDGAGDGQEPGPPGHDRARHGALPGV